MHVPIGTVGALTRVTGTANSGMNYFGTDNADNDGDGFIDEKMKKTLFSPPLQILSPRIPMYLQCTLLPALSIVMHLKPCRKEVSGDC